MIATHITTAARIRITGRMLGVKLAADEVVSERVPLLRKTWETSGEPRLLVIGSCRMGFTIAALRIARAALRPHLRGVVHPANDHRCSGGFWWQRSLMIRRSMPP